MSYAQFEFQVEHEDNILQARHIFEQANKSLRQAPNSGDASGKESRLLLLEAWQEFEEEQGDDITQVSKILKSNTRIMKYMYKGMKNKGQQYSKSGKK